MDERKTGKCEYCGKHTFTYKIKECCFTVSPITETIRQWCMDCFNHQTQALAYGKYVPKD